MKIQSVQNVSVCLEKTAFFFASDKGTKTRATAAGLLIAIFCIVVPSTGWGQNHVFLTAAGIDNQSVADDYYATIDPNGLRTTQSDFREVNGFNDPRNEVIDVRGNRNAGDLGFWRSVTFVRDMRPGYEGNIAFTTGNYNSEAEALLGDKHAVSIVNMEYSPGGVDGDMIVKFYVFDPVSGARKNSTVFDSTGKVLHLPAACFSCHGGDDDAETAEPSGYNNGSGETNATFLFLDEATMEFGATSLASLAAGFKAVNEAVLDTDPTSATRAVIKGLYGGSGLPNTAQDTAYVPQDWIDANEEVLYLDVVVPSCRSCHTTSDTKLLKASWWKANTGKIREAVFHEQSMPNSKPAFDAFWGSTQPVILEDALIRMETP